ncbi:hypothetical protein CBS101457_005176 [Exobasidium rhododendri]|nr:hypothetical protein CBS101457_005176 [Exobasidium rhododendri]
MLLLPPHGRRRQSQAVRASCLATTHALALLTLLAVLVAVFTPTVLAASPKSSVSRFTNLPARLTYIDDTTVVFYFDSIKGEVYRSEDEGKSFKPVVGPTKGAAYLLVEHPYDKTMVFILSNAKKHWRSTDRGKTWHSFETPEPPAVRAGAPLEFNADEKHWGHIIFTGKKCSTWTPWGAALCHDLAFYTTDAFATTPKLLVEYLMHCTWAKASKEVKVKDEHLKRIFCIAWVDSPSAAKPSKRSSHRAPMGSPTRLFYSDDYFASRKMVEFDIGRDAKGFVGFGPSKKYLVTALRDIAGSSGGSIGQEMALFVSTDGDRWKKANFPHGAGLTEGAYTIVEGTTHSMVVDVLDTTLGGQTGTLFTSDSEGSQFVKSLDGTNRNRVGIVDYEHLANIEGVSLANVRADIHLGGSQHGMGTKTVITFNDGSSWNFVKPPAGSKCGSDDINKCSLHLYSVTKLHNTGRVFSSYAPGFVMGVGNVGDSLLPYESCDTYLSTDAGRTWIKAKDEAHKYEMGDQGNILVVVEDEVSTDHISYSWNHGKKWEDYKFGISMRAKVLTTIPDGTSQKFLLIGTQSRSEAGTNNDRQVAVFLDFAGMKKQCSTSAMEKWDATKDQCLMGHKQYFQRRKPDADCYVGDKFHDPVSREDPCPCTEEDYECDFGYVRDGDKKCVQTGRDTIPAGECLGNAKTFKASSGYRKIPGNTCDHSRGVKKDEKVDRPCAGSTPAKGSVFHQTHEFQGHIVDHAYFSDSPNVLVQIENGNIWASLNDGLSWNKMELEYDESYPDARFVTMAVHPYDNTRAYLISSGQRFRTSVDSGRTWQTYTAPRPPNGMGINLLQFHPKKSDWLLWTGTLGDCIGATSSDCRAVAYYSLNNGRVWNKVEEYVKTCMWSAGSAKFQAADSTAIVCESYRDKKGNQRTFDTTNPLQLIVGANYYKNKNKIFEAVEGFAVFDEFLVVAEYKSASDTLTLMISLDGFHFAAAQFPPNTKLEKRAYTLLESNTNSIFMHGTTHSKAGSEWGALFRSNWNGTFYTLTLEHVNRNARGYVDFEKMLGLEGIALANIVSNPDQAILSGVKDIQTRITHNDAGRWKSITPPLKDALGEPQKCQEVGCSLQLHGYTERVDPRATYSSPSAVGLMIAVGNVGKKLAPYKDSDTFLTRDGGFTWEEVKKDAHMWEFGDQGSIIVLVNDEDVTNLVFYSLDQGLTWQEYSFEDKIRVNKIVTVPEDTHRKFIIFGSRPSSVNTAVAVHLDFTSLETRKCDEKKDFELWSPSEEANERCLFGREVQYLRRKRDADCFVGKQIVQPHSIVRNCTCTARDFECNYGYLPDPSDSSKCVAYQGVIPLAADADQEIQCRDSDYWYERTSIRKVPHSSCEGNRLDQGTRHACSRKSHGFLYWLSLICLPFGLAGLVGIWWNQREQRRRNGAIRLGGGPSSSSDSKFVDTLASLPYFAVGVAGEVWGTVLNMAERVPFLRRTFNLGGSGSRGDSSFGGYRTLRASNNEVGPAEEDAEILRNYEEEEGEEGE